MRYLKAIVQLSLMAIGLIVVVATSPSPGPDINDTWVISNVFDGETAVPVNHTIVLNIGYDDFYFDDEEKKKRQARDAFDQVRLYIEEDPIHPLELLFSIQDETTEILHSPVFAHNTRYVLDVSGIEEYLKSDRIMPGPISFTTKPGPRVTGLWKIEDTLFITFSEPMDETSLFLGHDSVDMFWEAEGELHSIAYDLNLANFVYDKAEYLFRVAPVDFLDSAWVRVSGQVKGVSGAFLDGNDNGFHDEMDDDYVQKVNLSELPECFTREDIPMPCVNPDEFEAFWF